MSSTTWEPASALSSGLVEEYECGVDREVINTAFSSGGETIHTLTSQPAATGSHKKPRVDDIFPIDTGLV